MKAETLDKFNRYRGGWNGIGRYSGFVGWWN